MVRRFGRCTICDLTRSPTPIVGNGVKLSKPFLMSIDVSDTARGLYTSRNMHEDFALELWGTWHCIGLRRVWYILHAGWMEHRRNPKIEHSHLSSSTTTSSGSVIPFRKLIILLSLPKLDSLTQIWPPSGRQPSNLKNSKGLEEPEAQINEQRWGPWLDHDARVLHHPGTRLRNSRFLFLVHEKYTRMYVRSLGPISFLFLVVFLFVSDFFYFSFSNSSPALLLPPAKHSKSSTPLIFRVEILDPLPKASKLWISMGATLRTLHPLPLSVCRCLYKDQLHGLHR